MNKICSIKSIIVSYNDIFGVVDGDNDSGGESDFV